MFTDRLKLIFVLISGMRPDEWRHLAAHLRATSVGTVYADGTDHRRKDSTWAEFPCRDISHNKKFVVIAQKVFGVTYFSRSTYGKQRQGARQPRRRLVQDLAARRRREVRNRVHAVWNSVSRVRSRLAVFADRVVSNSCAPLDGRRLDGRMHALRCYDENGSTRILISRYIHHPCMLIWWSWDDIFSFAWVIWSTPRHRVSLRSSSIARSVTSFNLTYKEFSHEGSRTYFFEFRSLVET